MTETKQNNMKTKYKNMECRLCLNKSPIQSIFLLKYCFLQTILNLLKINQDDGLPQLICKKCCNKLKDINNFMIKCEETSNILRNKYDLSIKKLSNPYDLTIKYEESTDDVSLDNVNKIQQGNIQIKSEVISHEDFYDETETDTNIKHVGNILKMDISELNKNDEDGDTSSENSNEFDEDNENGQEDISLDHKLGNFNEETSEFSEKLHYNLNAALNKSTKKVKVNESQQSSPDNKNIGESSIDNKVSRSTKVDSNIFECTHCRLEFQSKEKFFFHTRQHTENVYQCTFCPKNFLKKIYYLKHLAEFHQKKKSFFSQSDYLILKNYYLEKNILKSPATTEFQCEICKETLDNWRALKDHMGKSHKLTQFSCRYCDKTFKQKRSLRSHEEFVHFNKQKESSCMFCGKSFRTKQELSVHENTHVGIRDKQCDLCSKTFSSKINLKRHLALHSDKRPHVCSYCSKGFKESKKLKIHILLHTGETPHKCPVCLKGFAQKCNMKSHFVHNHKELDFNEAMAKFPKEQKNALQKLNSKMLKNETDKSKNEIVGSKNKIAELKNQIGESSI